MRLAAPSWVIPGSIAENARFLEHRVAECGLCLFESRASLAYTDLDLDPGLAALDLQWHIHFPLDLPWDMSVKEAVRICLDLYGKTAFLCPRFGVLHPPKVRDSQKARELLAKFAAIFGQKSRLPILLENVPWCDVLELGENFLRDNAMGFCLDIGHALGHAQKKLLSSDLVGRARLAHWSAPGGGDRHLPLTALTEKEKKIIHGVCGRVNASATHMPEIFNWRGIEESIPVLKNFLLGGWR